MVLVWRIWRDQEWLLEKHQRLMTVLLQLIWYVDFLYRRCNDIAEILLKLVLNTDKSIIYFLNILILQMSMWFISHKYITRLLVFACSFLILKGPLWLWAYHCLSPLKLCKFDSVMWLQQLDIFICSFYSVTRNGICGVMDSVHASSAVDRWFNPRPVRV